MQKTAAVTSQKNGRERKMYFDDKHFQGVSG